MSNNKMRESFEVGKSARDLTRSSRNPDEYLIDTVQINWTHWTEAWQAALEHRPAQQDSKDNLDAVRYQYIATSELYVGTSDFYCSEGGTLLGDSNENIGKAALDAYIDAAINGVKR